MRLICKAVIAAWSWCAKILSMTDMWIYFGFVLAVVIVTAIHIRIRDMEDDDR